MYNDTERRAFLKELGDFSLFHLHYKDNTEAYRLHYKEISIYIPDCAIKIIKYNWNYSYVALIWIWYGGDRLEEIVNLITNPFYQKEYIKHFGNDGPIPEDWLIKATINNV